MRIGSIQLKKLTPFAVVAPLVILATTCLHAQTKSNPLHTAPLNLDPIVREGYQRFYILDYEGALSHFESVLASHPQDPMASNYVLMVTVFRELYHQDLLDTTYYAHDSFLTSKRNVPVPQPTRDRIEALTNTV